MKNDCQFPDLASSTAHRRGCRCIDCNEWNNEKHRAVIARAKLRAAKGKPCKFPNHSASTAYQYGCRCPKCVAKNTERCRMYKNKNPRR
jgi:hypothetical protein